MRGLRAVGQVFQALSAADLQQYRAGRVVLPDDVDFRSKFFHDSVPCRDVRDDEIDEGGRCSRPAGLLGDLFFLRRVACCAALRNRGSVRFVIRLCVAGASAFGGAPSRFVPGLERVRHRFLWDRLAAGRVPAFVFHI